MQNRADAVVRRRIAIAAANGSTVVAWFTGADDRPAVRVVFSSDGGRNFTPPLEVDRGNPLGRVDVVALDDGSAVVSWLERAAGKADLMIRRVRPQDAPAALRVATTTANRASGVPRMVRYRGDLVLAWTAPEDAAPIRTARVRF